MTIDPSDHTVAELEEELDAVDDPEELEAMLDTERATENRVTAVRAIERRLRDVREDDEDAGSDHGDAESDREDAGSDHGDAERDHGDTETDDEGSEKPSPAANAGEGEESEATEPDAAEHPSEPEDADTDEVDEPTGADRPGTPDGVDGRETDAGAAERPTESPEEQGEADGGAAEDTRTGAADIAGTKAEAPSGEPEGRDEQDTSATDDGHGGGREAPDRENVGADAGGAEVDTGDGDRDEKADADVAPDDEPLSDLASELGTSGDDGRPDGEDGREWSEVDGSGGGSDREDADDAPMAGLASELRERGERRETAEGSDLFEEMDANVGELDGEELWNALVEGETPEVESISMGVEAATADEEATEHVVDKKEYCQRCPYLSDPPVVRCDHEGTSIVEVVDTEQFRVRNCPFADSEVAPNFEEADVGDGE